MAKQTNLGTKETFKSWKKELNRSKQHIDNGSKMPIYPKGKNI